MTDFDSGALDWRKETGKRALQAGRGLAEFAEDSGWDGGPGFFTTPRTHVHEPLSNRPLFDNQYAWHVRLCDRIQAVMAEPISRRP